MISRGPLSAGSGFGSVAGAVVGSVRVVVVLGDPRLVVVRAGGFGFGAGSVTAGSAGVGSSVFAVSTGVSLVFGVVVVRRGVVVGDVVGRRLRAVRGAGRAGAVSAGCSSVTIGFGDSTGVGAGVGSGIAGTTATSVSGGGGSLIRAPTEDARRPPPLVGAAPVGSTVSPALGPPSIARNEPVKDN